MTAPYENAEFIELGTIMPPEKFRTVLPEDRDAPGGLTEQKVVIEFRRDSPIYSQLLPCFRGAMFVYGFLRRGKGLRALFGDKYDEIKEKLKVSLHEWVKWNGNNLYTIMPIQQAADAFYQRQIDKLEMATERQRVAKLLREQESPA